MSNVLRNAFRYDIGNTFRQDGSGKNTGKYLNSTGARGFDCSGFAWWIERQSGYAIPYHSVSMVMNSDGKLSAAGSTYYDAIDPTKVKPGDRVYFAGHVGYVIEFDPITGLGRFYSMTGRNNSGKLTEADFSITKREGYAFGMNQEFLGFARPKAQYYQPQLDRYINDPLGGSDWNIATGKPPLEPLASTQINSGVSGFADFVAKNESGSASYRAVNINPSKGDDWGAWGTPLHTTHLGLIIACANVGSGLVKRHFQCRFTRPDPSIPRACDFVCR